MSEEGNVNEGGTESIELDDKVTFEVVDLALTSARAALAKVVESIKKETPDLVILGDAALAEAYATFVSFQTRANKLSSTIEGLANTLPRPKQDLNEGLEGALISEAALATLGEVTGFLAMFKAETQYYGRDITQDSAILNPLFASLLIKNNLVVAVPQAFAALPPGNTSALILELSNLAASRARLAAKAGVSPPADIAAVLAAADNLEAQIFGNPDSAVLATMLLGERVKALLDSHLGKQKSGTVLIASLRSVGAGGHVRTRKHLLTSLFTGDQVSFSAGSAIAWYLHDLNTGKLLGADIESETTRLRPKFWKLPWQDRWTRSSPMVSGTEATARLKGDADVLEP